MSSQDTLQARYDETPYVDQVFEHLDLSRLLGLASLFGLGRSDLSAGSPRVLDLACSSGEHIRSQAARYPRAQFTGIDFSASAIDAGRKAISESGLTNVELIEGICAASMSAISRMSKMSSMARAVSTTSFCVTAPFPGCRTT